MLGFSVVAVVVVVVVVPFILIPFLLRLRQEVLLGLAQLLFLVVVLVEVGLVLL
jgi:hypothetical protein